MFYTLLFEAGISDGLDRGKLVKTDTFPNRSVLQSVLNVNNIWRRHDFSHYSVINFARYVENLSPAEGVRALPVQYCECIIGLPAKLCVLLDRECYTRERHRRELVC